MTWPVCYVNNTRAKYTRVCVSIDGVWLKQTYSKYVQFSSLHRFSSLHCGSGTLLSQSGNEALVIPLLQPRLVTRLSKMVEMGAQYIHTRFERGGYHGLWKMKIVDFRQMKTSQKRL